MTSRLARQTDVAASAPPTCCPEEGFVYREAGPQLLMQAFLQGIVNGGERISREYGLGRKRTDLFLEWPLDEAQGYHGPVQRVVIELKLVRKAPEAALR